MGANRFGYWVFGKDMNNVKLDSLKTNGVTDIFLNFYAVTLHSEAKVVEWIKKAKKNNIKVHIWVQCFYDGSWINPKTANLNPKLKEIKKYANMSGVYGIHLDYLRYPGNAYKTSGGDKAITEFVKKVRSQNPKVFLSCAVMPEEEDVKYYGQDISALGKVVDCVIPMQYKGNYKAGEKWLASTSKSFSSKATIWSGLQSYKSDDDTTKLSASELLNDSKVCIKNGSKGIVVFRYGASPNMKFKSLVTGSGTAKSSTTISATEIKSLATTVKTYIQKNKKLPSSVTVNNKKYTYGQMAYILSFAVNNPGKALNVISVKNAESPIGDAINENLKKDDYQDVAKRTYNWIAKHKQCPNSAKTKYSKKKLRPSVLIDMMARIVAFYYTKKAMPNFANANSSNFQSSTKKTTTTKTTTTKTTTVECKNPYKAKPYNSNSSCDAMGQNTGYYCGCSMLQKMFYRLGYKVSQSEIARVAGTTTDGTGHDGLETAIAYVGRKFGVKFKVTWKTLGELGFEGMGKLMCKKNTAVGNHLLYRDEWGHYEYPLVVDVNNKTIKVINSLGSMCTSSCYCGYIEERSWSTHQRYVNGISQKSVLIIEKV